MTVEEFFQEWWTPKELPKNGFNKTAMLDFAEAYASQQRTEGIREGFEAARERGIRKRTYDGVGELPVYGNLYPTADDYLNSKK